MYLIADMEPEDIIAEFKFDVVGEELLNMANTNLGLSARAYDRILKVARTIADLADAPDIHPDYISETIQYGSLDRNLWEGGRLSSLKKFFG